METMKRSIIMKSRSTDGCKSCGESAQNRPSSKIKKRYVCFRCDRVFSSTRVIDEATCPYCKAVPCVPCGKTHNNAGPSN